MVALLPNFRSSRRSTSDLLRELAHLTAPDRVLTAVDDYTSDEALGGLATSPVAVVLPESTAEVAAIVDLAGRVVLDAGVVSLARGLGVAAERADTAEAFTTALERAFAEPGPHVVEAVLPSSV